MKSLFLFISLCLMSSISQRQVWKSDECNYSLEINYSKDSSKTYFYGSINSIEEDSIIYYKASCAALVMNRLKTSYAVYDFVFSKQPLFDNVDRIYKDQNLTLFLPYKIEAEIVNSKILKAHIITKTGFGKSEECVFQLVQD